MKKYTEENIIRYGKHVMFNAISKIRYRDYHYTLTELAYYEHLDELLFLIRYY